MSIKPLEPSSERRLARAYAQGLEPHIIRERCGVKEGQLYRIIQRAKEQDPALFEKLTVKHP
jgi:hypothetical protein